MPMYLSILFYQIKYLLSKSHREITYDLSRHIILFSDMNYLRLSLLGIWVRHSIISDKVILVDFIHSHTAIGTTTIFLIYKQWLRFETLLQQLYKHRQTCSVKCSWQGNLDNRDTDIDPYHLVIFWAIVVDKIWKYFYNHHPYLSADIHHCIHYILCRIIRIHYTLMW